MRPGAWSLVAVALATSCTFGTTYQKFQPAHTGLGASFVLGTVGGARDQRGELLVVNDSSMLVKMTRTGRIAVGPYARIRLMQFDQLDGSYAMSNAMNAGQLARWRTKARPVARYPQGLTPPQLAELLRATQQAAPDTLQ